MSRDRDAAIAQLGGRSLTELNDAGVNLITAEPWRRVWIMLARRPAWARRESGETRSPPASRWPHSSSGRPTICRRAHEAETTDV